MGRGQRVLLSGLAVIIVAGATYWYYGAPAARISQGGKAAAGGAAAVPITTAQAQIEDFAIRRRTIGIIESLATVVVKSRIESQVTAQHVKDGQLVKKDDLLFTLDDREIQATIALRDRP